MPTWKIVAIVGAALVAGVLLLGAVGLGMGMGRVHLMIRAVQDGKLGPALPEALPWPERHGVVGRVERVDEAARTIAVVNVRGEPCLVLLRDATVLERLHKRIDLSAVCPGERVVVIGSPDGQGRLIARAVRVLARGEAAPLGAEMLYRILRLMPPWFHWLLWRIV